MKKLNEYKEREIPSFHEANVTEKELFVNDKGNVIGAYFPDTPKNIHFLIDFILDKSKNLKANSIPHVYGGRKLASLFFGGVRSDGSLGKHRCTLGGMHSDSENTELLSAVSLLGEQAVQYAISSYKELGSIFERQRVQQKLKSDSNVTITDYHTSGSVNFDGLLGLHYDTASLKDTLNIIIYKRKGEGGNLLLPKYSKCIDAKDYSMAVLNVREVMHGVTAFKGGYRDCIVFYSVSRME